MSGQFRQDLASEYKPGPLQKGERARLLGRIRSIVRRRFDSRFSKTPIKSKPGSDADSDSSQTNPSAKSPVKKVENCQERAGQISETLPEAEIHARGFLPRYIVACTNLVGPAPPPLTMTIVIDFLNGSRIASPAAELDSGASGNFVFVNDMKWFNEAMTENIHDPSDRTTVEVANRKSVRSLGMAVGHAILFDAKH